MAGAVSSSRRRSLISKIWATAADEERLMDISEGRSEYSASNGPWIDYEALIAERCSRAYQLGAKWMG